MSSHVQGQEVKVGDGGMCYTWKLVLFLDVVQSSNPSLCGQTYGQGRPAQGCQTELSLLRQRWSTGCSWPTWAKRKRGCILASSDGRGLLYALAEKGHGEEAGILTVGWHRRAY